jgi:aspartyl-tRNA(Asn)/glutamyl-tRNA(Gln) amidotransferase subunit A
MTLTDLSLTAALAKLRAREISAVELTKAYLAQIDSVEGDVNAFITRTPERALADAQRADQKLAAGDTESALLGIPMAIKDVICTQGIQTTAGSRILEGFIPPYSATVMQRVESAGMVMLGKTNTDEFAMGSSTENSGYKMTRNPRDLSRIPGGSSGGSAAAVAAKMAVAALGTDTGGSIRQPAAMCGVVGLKPSYGRVSRYGVIAYGSSLEQVGAITRTVEDAATLLNVIAGHDPLDSNALDVAKPDYRQALTGEVRKMRVGVPKEYFIAGIEPSVEKAVHAAIDHFARIGAEICEVSLPHTAYGIPIYYLIAPAEVSANLSRYDGVRYGPRVAADSMWDAYRKTRGERFGKEAKRRIMLGTYALSAGYYDAYYLKAQKGRTLIRQDFEQAFANVDVIVTPTVPRAAFPIGEKVDDPLQMYLEDVFTVTANLAGICGISLPCGVDSNQMPIGLQVLGPAFGESKIIRAAHAYEQTTPWQARLQKAPRVN